ncbi:MAG: ABC transporter substrate-binding protein, partial [Armatimonadota bacterium]|nr:ABC transporter substrate-binding protein [Armatimonadota bacterium]
MREEISESVARLVSESSLTRREALRLSVRAAAAAWFLGFLPGPTWAAPKLPRSAAELGGLDKLIAAAKREGRLNTIALPPDWANYGEIMQRFSQKYGIRINNASPNASSAEELQAVRSLKGQRRAPDVLDIGPSFAIQGKQEGLFAPYKVQTWNTIPDTMKD